VKPTLFKGAFRMAKIRTNDGTFNVRGLRRTTTGAGETRYEFAHEAEGFGANPAGQANTKGREVGTANQRTSMNLRGEY